MLNKTKRIYFSTILFLLISVWTTSTRSVHRADAALSQGTYEVNSTDDVTDGFCNATHCSLREAINASNFNAGVQTIVFDLPLPAAILPQSELPAITEQVIIDGAAFGNGRCASNGSGPSDLEITLSGFNAGASSNGLILAPGSAGSTIRGLSIVNYAEYGIVIESDDNIIRCNHIGVAGSGLAGLGNGNTGIYITADGNRIGGEHIDDRNVISDNGGAGITITPGGGSNIVQNNYIGTNHAGEEFGGLGDGNGIAGIIVHGSFNLIGGLEDIKRNIIAGNSGDGIYITGPDNAISNNYIGVDINTDPLGNSGSGIGISTSSGDRNKIGDRAPNIIAHNGLNGIRISDNTATGNEVAANVIRDNELLGIDLWAENESIGDVTPNDGAPDADTGPNDLQNHPILLSAELSGRLTGTMVGSPGSDIRLDFYANSRCDDSGWGEGERFLESVEITIDSGGVEFLDLILSNPLAPGDYVVGTATDLDTGNTSEFGNCAQASEVIFVVNSTANTADANHGDGLCDISGTSTDCTLRAAINEINGSASSGPFRIEFDIPGAGPHVITPPNDFDAITKPVTIDGTTQPGAVCASSTDAAELLIVLDGSGMTSGNGLTLQVGSDGSEIRGLVIGNFPENGVRIASDDNVVACNHIGIDVSGLSGFGNGINGVRVTSNGNRIGGTSVSERNVIGDNAETGVLLSLGATGNDVKGNFIGTNAAGDAALGNGEVGVRINQATDNQVGGRREAAGNLISGNTLYGVQIRDQSDNNRVWNNRIGTDADGETAVPNGTGILVRNSDSNELGGDEAAKGNLIRGNSGYGVVILEDAEHNLIRYNSIANNGELGIDLNGDDVTLNDGAPDADSGGNNLQNFPVIAQANAVAGSITFGLSSVPATEFVIDFYRSASCDQSGYGEGQTHLSSGTVATDAAGQFSATVSVRGFGVGDFITAIATDPAGNSSEFSKCLAAVAPNQAVRGDYGDAPDSTNNQGVTPNTAYFDAVPIPGNFPTSYQNTVLGTGNPPGPVHFNPGQVHLGPGVSGEEGADIGVDQDGLNNIVDGAADNADNDGFDDGWLNPTVPFDHCYPTTLEVEVTNNTTVDQEMFLNVWFDGNRDGTWGQSVNCSGFFGEVVANPFAHEWIVRDEPLTIPPGTTVFPVTTFRVPNIDAEANHWIRFTLSEVPAGTQDGSSPFPPDPDPSPNPERSTTQQQAGYQFGETEDYLYAPVPVVTEPGEIVVTKSFDPAGPVAPGDLVSVLMTVEQIGGTGVVRGELKDALPPGLTYVRPLSLTETGTVSGRGIGYNPSANQIGWSGGLGPDSGLEIAFEVEVAACEGGLTDIINRAEYTSVSGAQTTADATLQVNCPVVGPEDITIEKVIKSMHKVGGTVDLNANPNLYLPGSDVVLETIIRNNTGSDIDLYIDEVIDYVAPTGVVTGVIPVTQNLVETVPANGEISFESEIVYRDWFDQLRIFLPENRFVATTTACFDPAGNNCLGASFTLEVEMGDLGDAPASDNHFGVDMDAYTGITAAFPTVFDAALPGPKIENAQPLKLGRWATYEAEADQGPDLLFTSAIQDNNIVPADNLPNRESGSDDGFSGNLSVQSCRTTMIDLDLTIRPQARDYFLTNPNGQNAYLNIWLDGDRDGAWSGSSGVDCGGGPASEQIVVNYPIDVVALYDLFPVPISVPTGAVPWLADVEGVSESRWMRVMLSDRPVTLDEDGFSNGGSDTDLYLYGEVEDYLVNNDAYTTVDEPADGACEVEEPRPTEGPDPDRAYYRFVVSYGNLSHVPVLNTALNLSIVGDDVDILRIVAVNRSDDALIADLEAPCADPANCSLALGQIDGGELGRAHVFFSVPADLAPSDIVIDAEVDFPDDPNPANDRDSITFRPTFLPRPLITRYAVDEVATDRYDVTLYGLSLPNEGLVVGIRGSETVTGTTQADADGAWTLTLTDLAPGNYRGRAAVQIGDVTGPPSRWVPIVINGQPVITTLSLRSMTGQQTDITLNEFDSFYDMGPLFNAGPGQYEVEALVDNRPIDGTIEIFGPSLDILERLTDPDGDGIYTGEITIPERVNQRSLQQAGHPLELLIESGDVSTVYTAEMTVNGDLGRIFDGETGAAVAGATVTPLLLIDGSFNGVETDRTVQAAPAVFSEFDGEYGLWLNPGRYQLLVVADRYQPYRTEVIDHSGGLLSLSAGLLPMVDDPADATIVLDENGGTTTVTVSEGAVVQLLNGSADELVLEGNGWDSGLLFTGESVTRRFETAGSFILTGGEQTIRILVEDDEGPATGGPQELFLPIIQR